MYLKVKVVNVVRYLKHALAIFGALCVLMAGTTVVAGIATAQTVARCGTTVDERPVVLAVHGFNGAPASWDEVGPNGTMNESIKLIQKVNLVNSFDYKNANKKWVTNENIGPALARQINCLSAASLEAGGNGKIIIVAHSMGGLALRETLNQSAAIHTSPSKIGLAIMIGTPNRGAWLSMFSDIVNKDCMGRPPFTLCVSSEAARAMIPESPQLKALPAMPRSVPVRAIATDMVAKWEWFGRKYSQHYGDGIVSVESATAEYTQNHPGDGKFVVECQSLLFGLCGHGDLLRNAQVQTKVVQALGEYLNSLPDPEPTPSPSAPTPTPSSPGGCEQHSPSATPTEEVIGGVGGGPSATPCP